MHYDCACGICIGESETALIEHIAEAHPHWIGQAPPPLAPEQLRRADLLAYDAWIHELGDHRRETRRERVDDFLANSQD